MLTSRALRPFAFFVFGLLATAFAHADEYSFKASLTQTHPFAADGEITFVNTNGNVTIRTWDRNEVRIEGQKSAKTQEELDLIEIGIDPKPDRIAIKTKLPKRGRGWFNQQTIRAQVTFTLTIPATARLSDIETVNGSISLEGTRGPVHAHSVNGRIRGRGLAADAEFTTVNGTIDVEFATLAVDQKISTRTVNGSSTITLPKDASLAFSGRCVNGDVTCDFPLKIQQSKRNRLSGTIGAGAATLDAESVNGGIHVKQL